MAGSQYSQTTMSLLKQGYSYLLNYYCFCSVDKNHHLHRRWINPFTLTLSFSSSENEELIVVINLLNSLIVVINLLNRFLCSNLPLVCFHIICALGFPLVTFNQNVPKCNLCRFRNFSSEPSELMILKD